MYVKIYRSLLSNLPSEPTAITKTTRQPLSLVLLSHTRTLCTYTNQALVTQPQRSIYYLKWFTPGCHTGGSLAAAAAATVAAPVLDGRAVAVVAGAVGVASGVVVVVVAVAVVVVVAEVAAVASTAAGGGAEVLGSPLSAAGAASALGVKELQRSSGSSGSGSAGALSTGPTRIAMQVVWSILPGKPT